MPQSKLGKSLMVVLLSFSVVLMGQDRCDPDDSPSPTRDASSDDSSGQADMSGPDSSMGDDDGGTGDAGCDTCRVNPDRKLTASDGAESDNFGNSVAVSGSTIVLGSPSDDNGEENSGSVYVFEDSGDGFVETQKLTAGDPKPGANFGFSVAVSGSTIVVGALESPNPNSDSQTGSAYVFKG
jgi:hypothetical protein